RVREVAPHELVDRALVWTPQEGVQHVFGVIEDPAARLDGQQRLLLADFLRRAVQHQHRQAVTVLELPLAVLAFRKPEWLGGARAARGQRETRRDKDAGEAYS